MSQYTLSAESHTPEHHNAVLAEDYGNGMLAVDSGFMRPRMACAWLLEAGDQVVVIETGTYITTPRLLRVLRERGWAPEQVSHVIVTHVHLDHAGGVGSLLAELPQARLLVHPRGARHMIDPSRLEASVRQVYGDKEFDQQYDRLLPIAEDRVQVMDDGSTLDLPGRTLEFIDTPGHARHHFCIWDALTESWFTGDTFGLAYPELTCQGRPFVFPTTTPIEFDPDALHQSIERLMEYRPRHACLTHFGRVSGLEPLAESLHEQIDAFVELTEIAHKDENPREALSGLLQAYLLKRLEQHGCALDLNQQKAILATDIGLNVQGLLFWWKQSQQG